MATTNLSNSNFWTEMFKTIITAISDTDSVTVKTANGTDSLITAELLRAYLQKGITPTIGTDGYWYIGGVLVKDASGNPLQISAAGQTPTIALKTIGGIKAIYVTYKGASAADTDWTLLVTASDLMFTFDDLTDAQKQSFLTYFTDAITNAETATANANTAATVANTAASNADTATSKANTAATVANTAASNADAATSKANTAATVANTAASNADAVATKAAKPLTISSDEVLAGSYNLDPNSGSIDIYEKTITLNNLPIIVGNTQEYVISDEPLGFGLFFNVDSFSVSSGKGLTKEFFQFNYQITRFYINENLESCISIKCVNAVSENVYGLLHIKYCKFLGDVIEFDVAVPSTVDKASVNLEIPVLKFNKKFLFSYINDDSYSIFQYIFSAINKRLIVTSYKPSKDDTREMSWHLGMEDKAAEMAKVFESYSPTEFLQCTDGAGVKRRFATTVATWPDKLKDGSIGVDVGGFWPWISEKEFKYFKDFGFTLGYHDLNGYDSNVTTQELFDVCLTNTVKAFNDNVGITPKLMIEPNGDHNYLTFSQNNAIIQVMTAQNGPITKKVYPFKSDFTLDKGTLAIERHFYDSNNTDYPAYLLSELDKFHSATDKTLIYWLIGSAHRSGYWETDFFTALNNKYGAKGDDTVWVPTIDEMYEYTFMRQGTVWKKTITDAGLHFKMFVPKMPNFFFRDISVLLSGISDITGVSVTSGNNVYGTSYAVNNGKLLINLDFNSDLLSKVERYVSDYEANYNANYKYDDAYYFVQKLKDGLRQPYLNRLNVYVSPPTFTGLTINSGATGTQNNNVTLAFTYTGQAPTYYMASENSDFSGANWLAYSPSVSFVLSDNYVNKTIYVKLKNPYGESGTLHSSIMYNEPTLALSGVSIQEGASTTNQAITIIPVYVGIPTQVMVSENSDFSGASWANYTGGNVSYILSSGYGSKTVYVKLKNDTTTTTVLYTSINYIDATSAILNGIAINNGDAETNNGTVSVAINVANTITKYKIGVQPDLSDCPSWITWTGSPVTFASGITSGTITVYVQVANDTTTSVTQSDSIDIMMPIEISSLVISGGDSSHSGYTVPVEFMITSGTPTHYKLAESLDALNSMDWQVWPNPGLEIVNYTFASSGSKTIYGQVKNAVSTSAVMSDDITIKEAPVVILLANVASGGVIDGVGYVQSLNPGNSAVDIKDTNSKVVGRLVGTYIPYNSNDFSAMDTKYSCSHIGGFGKDAYWDKPTLPVATIYPNEIISDGSTKNELTPIPSDLKSDFSKNRQNEFIIKGLSAGNYKVRLLFCEASSLPNDVYPARIYVQNQYYDMTKSEESSKVINNNSQFYTFDSVVVDSDGYLCGSICWPNLTSIIGYYHGPSLCVVEVTKL